MREIAEDFGGHYARFRNHLMLTVTCDGSAISGIRRHHARRSLFAPPKNSLLFSDDRQLGKMIAEGKRTVICDIQAEGSLEERS